MRTMCSTLVTVVAELQPFDLRASEEKTYIQRTRCPKSLVASTAEEDHTGEYHTGDSASTASVQSSSPFMNDGNGVRGSHGAATLDPTEPPPGYAAFVFEQSIVKRPATIAMSCSLIALAIGVALLVALPGSEITNLFE